MNLPRSILKKIKDDYQKRQIRLEQDGIFFYLKKSNGYVLIIVMVICTLLISVSSEFLLNAQININYMKRFRNEASAQSAAEAGINLAQMLLEADRRGLSLPSLPGSNSDKTIDTYNDIWAMDFPEIEIGRGSVKIIIRDEQSKINISAVSTEIVDKTPFYSILERFTNNMGFPVDYAEAVIDWVDTDSTKTGNGAESFDYYSTLPVPYEAANTKFDSIDQLLLVKYFTPEIFYGFGGGNAALDAENESIVDTNAPVSGLDIGALVSGEEGEASGEDEEEEEIPIGPERSRRLSDYLRAHGDTEEFNAQINRININTATYRVLLSLTDEMTDEDVVNIIKRRNREPFKKVDDASEFINDELIRNDALTTSSNLFRITSIGYVHGDFISIEMVYDRSRKKIHYYSVQ